jgi:hypothetical protein
VQGQSPNASNVALAKAQPVMAAAAAAEVAAEVAAVVERLWTA